MKKFNKNFICASLVICMVMSSTGCSAKKDHSIYNEPAQTTEVTEEKTTEVTTQAPAPVTPIQTEEGEIDVKSIIENSKQYIQKKGCLEQVTDVEWTNTRTTEGIEDTEVTKAKLESGFNQDFYYIVEESSVVRDGSESKNNGYVFCMDKDFGYIHFNEKEYKILTPIVLETCELSDVSVNTFAERYMKDLILDLEYCTFTEEEDCYIVEQRLSYQDLAINKANSCSFSSAFGEDTSVRQELKFDKETFALLEYNVICSTLDVSQGEENRLTVHAEYTYEQNHTYDSSTLDDCIEIDSFQGYSIY